MHFNLQAQVSKLGLSCSEQGVDLSFLMLGEVETQGSTHLEGKPLPQCKPSTSDVTSEAKKKLRPKTLHEC